jgi:hypothetical protein
MTSLTQTVNACKIRTAVQLIPNPKVGNNTMKTLQINVPDEVMARLEKLATEQGGDNYVSVNTNEVNGRDGLFTDLLILGLDELQAGEAEFPD